MNLPMNILSRQPKLKPKLKPKPIRCGFTLVELLFVIAIIAILSSLSLAMIRSAQLEARSSATQSRLTHIQNILSIYIEDMEFRKLPFRMSQLDAFVLGSTPQESYGKKQQLRNQVLADYMNVEMPRDANALGTFPSPAFTTCNGSNLGVQSVNYAGLNAFLLMHPTALTRRWSAMGGGGIDNQGELLYELLLMIDFEGGSALESLGNGAIGDSDGDGNLEVVDAWGEPFQFDIAQRTLPNETDWEDFDVTVTKPREFQHFRFDVWSDNVPRRVEF